MPKPFYNTINLEGEKLQKQVGRALAQQDFVKELFLANPDIKLSPSQIQHIASRRYDRNVPLTSWRRAMTNLTYDDYGKILCKTGEKVIGEYGLPEHLWELNKQSSDGELQQFLTKLQEEEAEKDKPKFVQKQLF